MHDQILLGVLAAQECSRDGEGSPYLRHLTQADVQILVREVLTALATAPEGTPEPTATLTPASTPMLVISPASVIAHAAQEALNDVRHSLDARGTFEPIILDTWAAGADYREYREFLFRIQPLYGARIRSIRTEDGTPMFKVAGTQPQVEALQRTAMMIHSLAEPVIATLDRDQQRAFWATLGVLCADGTDDSDHLHETNRATYAEATEHLNSVLGPARNLPRTTPAYTGAIYEQAMAVMGESARS